MPNDTIMNTYQRALIDYWLEIGKLKRVRSRCFKDIEAGEIRENPDSPWLYIFVRDDGIELPMRNLSWTQFFQSFHIFNHVAFQCEIDPASPPLRPELEAWLPFDPWRNPAFIEGMTVTFDFEGLGVAKNKATFLLTERLL